MVVPFSVSPDYYQVGVVRKLCKSGHIDSKGSRFDLITRLREQMKSGQTYDKVFRSIWGASGKHHLVIIRSRVQLLITITDDHNLFNLCLQVDGL